MFLRHLELAAHHYPDRPALVAMDRIITYQMLWSGSLSVASLLQTLGVKPGALVGLQVPRPAWNMIASLALAHLGAVCISLTDPSDIAQTGIAFDLVITQEPVSAACRTARIDESWFTRQDRPVGAPAHFGADDLSRVSFSSGTTGRRKPIGHTVTSIERRAVSRLIRSSGEPWSRLLLAISVNSNFGFTTALAALSVGRTVYFAETVEEGIRMLPLFGIDALIGAVGAVGRYADLLAARSAAASGLRLCMVGGAQVSADLGRKLLRYLTPNTITGYSSTECGPSANGLLARLDLAAGAVGHLLPGAQVEILDDEGRPLPHGQTGRLRIRTETIARPLQISDGRLVPAPFDGWHMPGDLGWLRADGMLHIAGRADYLVNIGGEKQAPDSLEERLRGIPGVVDIAIDKAGAQAAGVSALLVAPHLTDTDFRTLCHMLDARILVDRIIRANSIPRTDMGKVERAEVRRLIGGTAPTPDGSQSS